MFHASSCSETELGDKSTAQLQVRGECSGQQTMESSTSMAQRQDTAPVALAGGQILIHKNQELHRPHDHPLPPVFERPQASAMEYTDCHAASGILTDGRGQEGRTVDLSSRSVQMEIVQMRDELKRFHDLKLHHKQLEAQLSARIRQGGSETGEVKIICLSEELASDCAVHFAARGEAQGDFRTNQTVCTCCTCHCHQN